MLKYLHIENIAVIENTEIDFTTGFNALTGETGAGKSIIIDSINAVLGERTSKELIRTGTDKACVQAVFCDIGADALSALAENDIFPDEDGNLIIERTLSNSGSMVKIGGKPVSVGVLKSIAKNLVNIHGQHGSVALLNPDNHYIYIDKIAENEKELNDYYLEFKNLNRIRKELSATEIDDEEKQRKKEFLEYEIGEIEKAKIEVGEYASLKENLRLAESFENTMKSISLVEGLLSGNGETDGAQTLVDSAKRTIDSLNIEKLKPYLENLDTVYAELETVSYGIREFANSMDSTNYDKDTIRDRLDVIKRLMNKYGGSEEKILAHLEESKAQLEALSFAEEKRDKLSDLLDESTQKLIDLGEKLTKTRVNAAKKFAKDVCENLKSLDMQNVVFDVSIDESKYTKYGKDKIEFTIVTNVGEDKKPLAKIASGGELSRIMLSIESVLSTKDNVDTLIFDEIDTGISGFAAEKVGEQLKKVSKDRQVVCVTHLAQIAAKAENHLKIEKTVNDGRTYTSVSSLSYEERINEIARIMSGTDMTEKMYNSAKELLDRSI